MEKHAATKKEISCIVAHLFQSLELPCKECSEDTEAIIIKGETYNGKKATMYIEEEGVFYLAGDKEIEGELQAIRDGRCIYDRNR